LQAHDMLKCGSLDKYDTISEFSAKHINCYNDRFTCRELQQSNELKKTAITM